MNLILAETAGNSYPQLDQRLEQAQNAGQAMQVRASGGSSFQLPFTQYGLTGEIAVGDQFSPSSLLITSLMKDNSVTFSTGSFGATLQLRGSRKAICNVINRCGAVVQGCQPKPKKVVKPRVPKTNPGRCRARSVWVSGRGCILRKYINQGPAKGCRAGQVRFAGQCMYPSEKRGFCGPGYTPRGNRCVSNAAVIKRPRIQQGVFVTQAYCRRLGLTKEGNYCVEDD